ncbi:adenosylcobinamide-GDP ribazoletransferase [Halorientalis sp.]|uniref:adenosylcobinamide-GDP ribazoletransferase n=1 Tax=Halorientalis sp. TaxID=1931229 RepID=UPI00263049ED|nr:adenosylcobinamide-GDP ribazoletransferase [Halorientalis sp.]
MSDDTETREDMPDDATPGPSRDDPQADAAGDRTGSFPARTADAARGALGFLTRTPVGTDRRAWAAFRRTPAAFVPVGYLVGTLAAVPVLAPLPVATAAVLFPLALVGLTGINHADGVADIGDAAVVHGGEEPIAARRRVLKDSSLGVGGALALALLVAGLSAAGAALAGLPRLPALAIVVAAEVSGKLGMAMLACLGTAPADGLGAQLTRVSGERDLLVPLLLALPAAVLSVPSPAAAVTLGAGVLTALSCRRWADARLRGVNGDVFGAANELARVVGLHAGVIAWTLS